MKVTFILLFCFLNLTFVFVSSEDDPYHRLKPKTPIPAQTKAVDSLIDRLLGADKSQWFISVINESLSVNGKDTFQLSKTEDDAKVTITGSSGVAVAWGLHHYLKAFCGCHISWDGDQLNLPSPLPNVNLTKTTLDRWRYYQNVVTSSYSYVWWKWPRWEREIDWMALNGINLALAFNGQEAIWERVYIALNINDHEFTGPAFLAWNRMGNMRAFGGGLTPNWNNKQVELQHLILNRMRELGITPVLPSFAGLLPRSFADFYPNSNYTYINTWNGFGEEFCCPLLLNPTDPLFNLISRIFLREYINEFGTNHIYNCDTFNENEPSTNDTTYLAMISQSIFNGIDEVDPSGIWMLQGWMFIEEFWGEPQVEAYVTSVPQGRMLILDLQSDINPQYERLHSYYGQPFIWCMLLNFGGQTGMYGFLDLVNEGVVNGRHFENSTMIGIGLTPEGIDQNYIMYEFMLESAFRNETVNVSEWVTNYHTRRYGGFDPQVNDAWELLRSTVYNFRSNVSSVLGVDDKTLKEYEIENYGVHLVHNLMTKRPNLNLFDLVWYNRTDLWSGYELFVAAAKNETISNSSLFQHDLADVTRQIIQLSIGSLYHILMESYRQKDQVTFGNYSDEFIALFQEMDNILSTNKKFLLGVWLEDAKSLATNTNETINYEYNARNQITLWGPKGEISDYAAKQWSGLLTSYYKPRWELFIDYLNNSITNNQNINFTILHEEMFYTIESPFTFDRNLYPTEPVNNTIPVVLDFYERFEGLADLFSRFVEGGLNFIPEVIHLP